MDIEPTTVSFTLDRSSIPLNPHVTFKYVFYKRVIVISLVNFSLPFNVGTYVLNRLKRSPEIRTFWDMVYRVNTHLNRLLAKENRIFIEMTSKKNLPEVAEYLVKEVPFGDKEDDTIKYIGGASLRGKIDTGAIAFPIKSNSQLLNPRQSYFTVTGSEFSREVLLTILEKQGLIEKDEITMIFYSEFLGRDLKVHIGKDTRAIRHTRSRLRLLTLNQLIEGRRENAF